MSQVPTSNVSALYTNTTTGTVASPTIMDAAIQDIVSTINANDSKVDALVTSGTLSPVPPDFMQRQAIINGNFDVCQRGVIFTNPANLSYGVDRWRTTILNSGTLPTTLTHSRQVLNGGTIDNTFYSYRINTNGPGSGFAAGDVYVISQPIENGVRYLCGAGKKVTLSFWAKSDIVGKRIGAELQQNYGSGGAPSTADNLTGNNFTLTNTWKRYSVTFNTTTLFGKVFGSNNDDTLLLTFAVMWGTTRASRYNASTPETFVGNGNIDIAQVQICAGDVALPFQPRSFAEELQLCQRYYEKSFNLDTTPADGVGPNAGSELIRTQSSDPFHSFYRTSFKVRKRISSPTVNLYNPGNVSAGSSKIRNVTSSTDVDAQISSVNETGYRVYVNNIVIPAANELIFHWTVDAEF